MLMRLNDLSCPLLDKKKFEDTKVVFRQTIQRGYATNTKIDLSHKIRVENEIPPGKMNIYCFFLFLGGQAIKIIKMIKLCNANNVVDMPCSPNFLFNGSAVYF
jgi:hypothetical protein